MARFRKKPIEVEAEQFLCDVPPLNERGTENTGLMFGKYPIYVNENGPFIWVDLPSSPGGRMRVANGEYIVTESNGSLYPCKPDLFEAIHEPIEGDRA